MYKEALLFLFFREEYEKLLTLIKDQFIQEKDQIKKLREKLVTKGKAGAKQITEEQKKDI